MEALAGTTVGGLLVKDLALDQVGAFWDHIQDNRDLYIDVIPFVSLTPSAGALAQRMAQNLDRQAQGLAEFYTLWDGDRMAGYFLVREKEPTARWAEIGYMLGGEWQGRGVTTTLCQRLIDKLFDQGMEKIVICCNDDNSASLAVAKKLGFTLEGVIRNHFVVNGRVRSMASLGLLRSEWTAPRSLAGAYCKLREEWGPPRRSNWGPSGPKSDEKRTSGRREEPQMRSLGGTEPRSVLQSK